jgi:hypothetical protein
VIECEILGGKLLPAVLTRVIVARVDVGARKLHAVVVLNANIFEKPNDRRKFDGERYCVDLLIVLVNDFNFTREQQR